MIDFFLTWWWCCHGDGTVQNKTEFVTSDFEIDHPLNQQMLLKLRVQLSLSSNFFIWPDLFLMSWLVTGPPGPQLHRRLLGQVCGLSGLQAGLPDRDMSGELCGEVHRHHADHHQPLHTDGTEGHALMTDSGHEDMSDLYLDLCGFTWFSWSKPGVPGLPQPWFDMFLNPNQLDSTMIFKLFSGHQFPDQALIIYRTFKILLLSKMKV